MGGTAKCIVCKGPIVGRHPSGTCGLACYHKNYKRNNKAKFAGYHKKNYPKNKDRWNANKRSRYKADPVYREKIRVNINKWRAANRVRYRASTNAMLLREKRIVIAMLGGKCVCCGLTAWWCLTIDHIRPLRGRPRPRRQGFIHGLITGRIPPDNLQVLCSGCNMSKGTGTRCRLNHRITNA